VKFMLLIYSNLDGWNERSQEEQDAIFAEYMALRADGRNLGSAQLEAADTATTVVVKDGATVTTDGPFAETKEALGGYYLIEADSREDAVAWAARIPAARLGGSVEVRPVVER
jgi:hypothetical protein